MSDRALGLVVLTLACIGGLAVGFLMSLLVLVVLRTLL